MLLTLFLPGIVAAADHLKKVILKWFNVLEYLLYVVGILAVVLFYMRKHRINDSFHEIKKLIGPKETDLTNLNSAISEINSVSKFVYIVIDSVDVKLDGYDYKLVKCEICSSDVTADNSKSILVCALDRSSSKVAKGMRDLL